MRLSGKRKPPEAIPAPLNYPLLNSLTQLRWVERKISRFYFAVQAIGFNRYQI